ncbi:MAG: uracil-DNA glycosylase [Hyphomicrobium sp.]
MLEPALRSGLVALLDWYRAMGVDQATGEEAVDWLARGPHDGPGHDFRAESFARPADETAADPRTIPAPTVGTAPVPVRQSVLSAGFRSPPSTAPASPAASSSIRTAGAAETAARDLAGRAASLADLGAALAAFEGCGLKTTAKNLCLYRGSPQARLMLIGEAPGRDEDIAGRPFVGRAGQLLDRMLSAIGLGEADVHITNVVYWRPPGNRTPTPQEVEQCRPFVERQVELVAPEIVLVLGGVAAKPVLGTTEGIMKLRGRWQERTIGRHACQVMATLHPAYLLRTPAAKRQAWSDLLAIKSRLRGDDTPSA